MTASAGLPPIRMGSSHIFTASQSFRKCHLFVHLHSRDLSTSLMCHHCCTSSATLYQDRIPADRVREISDDSLSSFKSKHGLNPRLLPRPRQSTVCTTHRYIILTLLPQSNSLIFVIDFTDRTSDSSKHHWLALTCCKT